WLAELLCIVALKVSAVLCVRCCCRGMRVALKAVCSFNWVRATASSCSAWVDQHD
ncbi:hypothetical protein SOVF_145090, partial [Spinacia oleracea]